MARLTATRQLPLQGHTLAYAPSLLSGRDNTVYAYGSTLWSRKSADTSILQKSVDYGQSWTDVYDFTYAVGIIIVCDNGNILVSQKTDGSFFTDPPAQLYLSTDGGTTFTSILTLASGGFESFSYDVRGNTVFVGEYGKYNSLKLYRSTDGGATWTVSFTHPVDGSATVHLHKVHIDKTNDTTIYVSAGDNALAEGVWYSTDEGTTWSVLTRDHQPTWMETDADYLYLGEDLEGDIHRIEKDRFSEGEAALELVYSAQNDPRGTFGNLSFYSGATDSYGNIYFGGVAYGIDSVQNNNRDTVLAVSHDQGESWAVMKVYTRRPGSTSSGPSVMSKEADNGYIYVRTSNPSTVEKLDTAAVNVLLRAGLNRTAVADRTVLENLVPNGRMEVYPAATTPTGGTATRWIDGTAGGSQAKRSAYEWAIPTGGYAGTSQAVFDTTEKYSGSASLKLSKTNATGAITVATYRNATPLEYFAIQPNTAYTLTAKVKTTNADANGAYVDFREFTASGTTVITRSSNKLTGTNDWTTVTISFTTGATSTLGAIFLRLNVVGAIADAWFDNVTLTRTLTRSAV